MTQYEKRGTQRQTVASVGGAAPCLELQVIPASATLSKKLLSLSFSLRTTNPLCQILFPYELQLAAEADIEVIQSSQKYNYLINTSQHHFKTNLCFIFTVNTSAIVESA